MPFMNSITGAAVVSCLRRVWRSCAVFLFVSLPPFVSFWAPESVPRPGAVLLLYSGAVAGSLAFGEYAERFLLALVVLASLFLVSGSSAAALLSFVVRDCGGSGCSAGRVTC